MAASRQRSCPVLITPPVNSKHSIQNVCVPITTSEVKLQVKTEIMTGSHCIKECGILWAVLKDIVAWRLGAVV
jgi:hypothetical protein